MKNNLFLSDKIEIRTVNDRRGVFCTMGIAKGELIEESHLILLDNNKWEECDKKLLEHAFPWPELRADWKDFCDEHGGILPIHATRPVIILGYGMIYGRGKDYNMEHKIEKKLFACLFTARCDIKVDEELLLTQGDIEKQNERQST